MLPSTRSPQNLVAVHSRGARPEFIASLPRPKTSSQRDATCPVCLQTLASIETEEEYALASESYFGDVEALGLRELPCQPGHIVCARCAMQWLTLVSGGPHSISCAGGLHVTPLIETGIDCEETL